jgi:hypothetical protein
MFSPRSFRLRRRLALCLALATILATVAPPLHASPLDRAGIQGPVLGLIDWVQGLLLTLGVTEVEDAEGPNAVFLPDGQCMEPNGAPIPCPKTTTPDEPTETMPATAKLPVSYRMR